MGHRGARTEPAAPRAAVPAAGGRPLPPGRIPGGTNRVAASTFFGQDRRPVLLFNGFDALEAGRFGNGVAVLCGSRSSRPALRLLAASLPPAELRIPRRPRSTC